jgi:TetR/AcrR family transcriptional regulator, transcriptional repressor of bet genes
MARIPISRIRRLELEKAVWDAVKEKGFRGLGLEEVAKHAGTAKGTIHHYFNNKAELMESTARYANREFSQTALRMIKAASSASERLWSILALNLDSEFARPEIVRLNVLVLANGIQYPSLLRIYEATHERSISNISFALRSLARREDVKSIANNIWTIIEGAWVLQATREEGIGSATLSLLADYLKNTVPDFDSSVVQNLDHFPEGPTPSNNRT